jgi:O-methyltransferase
MKAFVKQIAGQVLGHPLLRPCGLPVLHAIQYGLGVHHREVVNFNQPVRAKEAERIRQIVTQWRNQTMGVDEAYLIRSAVLGTAKIPGDIAEVGVYRGGTARVISEAKGNRPLHLFDTFEGLPDPGENDAAFSKGQYACSLDAVQRYLQSFPAVYFHKGYFPDSGASVRDHCFSFVHLDVDLYESTRGALEYFYPRMSAGGIFISHDYVEFEGVRRAVDEFFANKPEPVVEMTGNQCMVIHLSPSRIS